MIPAAELLRPLRSAPDGTVRNLSPTLWGVVAVKDLCTRSFSSTLGTRQASFSSGSLRRDIMHPVTRSGRRITLKLACLGC